MVCVKCGCDKHQENAIYCRNCGIELDANYCTNPDCLMNNGDEPYSFPADYCYCDQCGSETEYFKAGYIKPLIYEHDSQ